MFSLALNSMDNFEWLIKYAGIRKLAVTGWTDATQNIDTNLLK